MTLTTLEDVGHELMLGAVCGDSCGSVYEHCNIKTVLDDAQLIRSDAYFTDDTVMTVAVAGGIRNGLRKLGATDDSWVDDESAWSQMSCCVQQSMYILGNRYPFAGYGGRFRRWLASDDPRPYESWGNGSGMRTSYPGWVAVSKREALALARISAEITHNHPLGVKGAVALTDLLFALRGGGDKRECASIAASYYDMDFTLNDLRPHYRFDVSCEGSVPVAIKAFLEGESFAQVIALAISVGGDSDTIAAMAGMLAEAVYPMPDALIGQTLRCLDQQLTSVLKGVTRFAINRARGNIGCFDDGEDVHEDERNLSSDDWSAELIRFRNAQSGVYEEALAEITKGRKTGHWMWFILPQIRGLGHSGMSQYYGIKNLEEARAYLRDPVLGHRLLETVQAIGGLGSADAKAVFGYTDAKKLRSAMTLFREAAVAEGDGAKTALFQSILDKWYDGTPDARTLMLIGAVG